ncbi:hypothetical protein PR048_011235 [Dryococelus australis]|uniref:Uncharacterized protein n=1 Tax=Dryococelus australis TaxID=614101 RepID=A0ABQ9HLK8_9NEOP|nr:hypothetical protein PR048_011235 [Dryococelus australis]
MNISTLGGRIDKRHVCRYTSAEVQSGGWYGTELFTMAVRGGVMLPYDLDLQSKSAYIDWQFWESMSEDYVKKHVKKLTMTTLRFPFMEYNGHCIISHPDDLHNS